jgi:hypothetical protein
MPSRCRRAARCWSVFSRTGPGWSLAARPEGRQCRRSRGSPDAPVVVSDVPCRPGLAAGRRRRSHDRADARAPRPGRSCGHRGCRHRARRAKSWSREASSAPVDHPRARSTILGPGCIILGPCCIRREQATRGGRRWCRPGCFIAGGATRRPCCPRSGQDVSSEARRRPRDESTNLTGRQPRRLCAAAANAPSACCASGNDTPHWHVAHGEPVSWPRRPGAATHPGHASRARPRTPVTPPRGTYPGTARSSGPSPAPPPAASLAPAGV